MNIETVRQHLRIFWDMAEMNGVTTPELPADHLAAVDQARARIKDNLTEMGAFDLTAQAYLAGALAALDMLASDLAQGQKILQPEAFVNWLAPMTMNVWMRAWAVEASEATGVATK